VEPPEKPPAKHLLIFQRVGLNLYRLTATGGYYALLKRVDKQFRRSLRTKDRRLAQLRNNVGNLTTDAEARLTFDELSTQWEKARMPRTA
jgi:hypothetical protein